MQKNIFEKIIDGEIPSKKVLENENFLAFEDINPQAPIHILIIPKQSIKDFQQAHCIDMQGMTLFIQEVVKHLGIEQEGYRLITNVGTNGGQEVPHLHFHLLAGAKLKWGKMY
ncbi:histidine triad nucleotide-binding protein [Helicobacter enhydrae]|uniref:Histidine triad nucleotide-binding protein n=1 Tax=Helicobacter enhydrae TaxID=222136 RepID=A0A1B1U4X7_9HELI|nr:histidine triad nucleotide-binding protein [Helicobacter enhydrae]ANV97791.1 histidine triad nucleotide-binding protein [Helicobacter enhydrae]